MTKILLKTLVITFAIQAISGTYAQVPDAALASESEDNNGSVNLQIPDRRLSRQEVHDALSTLSSSINTLTERLEQNSSSLEETSNGQRQLKKNVAGIKGELDGLKQGFSELTEETVNLTEKSNEMVEKLDQANRTAISRDSEVTESIKDMVSEISTLRDETVKSLESQLESQKKDIQWNADLLDEQRLNVKRLDEQISGLSSSVGTRVGKVEKSVKDGFLSVESDVLFRTVAGTVLLLILSVLLILIRRQLAARHRVLSVEFADSSEAILEGYNKLDLMLSELLSKQLSTIAESPDKHDHTLPLEVAAEVHRMRKRIARMPDDVKGVKQLEKALERLEDSLARKSYEIINLLGEKYVEGLNVNPRFSIDEDFEPDMRIITNVIKPQVNYEDKIIQIADVEVSVGK